MDIIVNINVVYLSERSVLTKATNEENCTWSCEAKFLITFYYNKGTVTLCGLNAFGAY